MTTDGPRALPGRLFDPAAPSGRPVHVQVDGTGLTLVTHRTLGLDHRDQGEWNEPNPGAGDERTLVPWDACRLSLGGADDGMARVQARVAEAEVDLFVPDVASFLDLAEAAGPPALRELIGRLRADRRRRAAGAWSFWGLVCAVGLLCCWFLWRGLVWSERRIVDEWIPISVETTLAEKLEGLVLGGKTEAPPEVGKAMDAIMRRLVAAWDERSRNRFGEHVKVRAIQSTDVNAFAMPGGKMAVLTGLIDKSDSEDEVAMVLAHELQHVANRDALATMVANLKWHFVWMFVVGDLTATQELLLGRATALLNLRYSREMEARADDEGLLLMARAGYDPGKGIRFFEKLAKDEGRLAAAIAFLSDHPATMDRVSALEALRAKLPPSGGAPPAAAPPAPLDWDDVKRRASGKGD